MGPENGRLPRPRCGAQFRKEREHDDWNGLGIGRGGDSHPGTLTFANDPVQDGLQLLDADLHVLGEEEVWMASAGIPPFTQGFPTPPPPARSWHTSPASLLNKVLKVSSISSSESTFCTQNGENRSGCYGLALACRNSHWRRGGTLTFTVTPSL